MLAKTAARVAVPAIIGTVPVGSLVLPAVLADEETGLGPGLIGAALLLSPYLILSLAGVRTPTVAWLTVLGLLVGSTVFGLLTAGSSSTGGLVFLWLVPAQWVLSWSAALLGYGAFRGPSSGRSRPHER